MNVEHESNADTFRKLSIILAKNTIVVFISDAILIPHSSNLSICIFNIVFQTSTMNVSALSNIGVS